MADIIRAGALWGYCPLTRFLAHDPKPLLEEVDLNEVDLDNTDAYIPRPSVATLLERSAAQLDCSDFALRLAGVQDINILGALAFSIRNAPDLRGAVAAAARHVHYHSPSATLTLAPSERPGETSIKMRRQGPRATPDEPQLTEHSTALFCRVIAHLSGGEVKPARIDFAHAPMSSSDVYAEHFGLAPNFAASEQALSFNNADLAMPLKGANKHLKALVDRYLDLYAPGEGASAERRVHQAIAQLMRHSAVSIEDVCDMLHMHPRTLQRRLAEEGVTFERVRDNVRKEMAEAYLTNPLVPLAHVAHMLGYANQSVLTRSCLRWFGRTPLAMRQHMLGRSR